MSTLDASNMIDSIYMYLYLCYVRKVKVVFENEVAVMQGHRNKKVQGKPTASFLSLLQLRKKQFLQLNEYETEPYFLQLSQNIVNN